MKSIRLNSTMRSAIIDNMIKAFEQNWFNNKPYKDLDTLLQYRSKKRIDIMITLWDKVYGCYSEAISSLPDFFFKKNTLFSVSAGGNGKYCSLTLPNRPGKESGVDLLIEEDEWDIYFQEITELNTEEELYKKELGIFKQEIKAIIESVSTTKQLVELWSNAEEFIPMTLIDPNNINLPAINVTNINSKLGLG